jgi:glycosyltransferase involved in cell wall biosynthesis
VKLLVFAKYPPIEGGTASQTYVTVGLLAKAGHDIDVVTNAAEAELACRAILSASDRACIDVPADATPGSVTVHNTTPVSDHDYVPWAKPYASQLFGLGMTLLESNQYDAVIGWYWEPYGLVAGQVAQVGGLPLVLRHAGSDVRRLAKHPDLGPAYQWLLQHSDRVLTGPRNRDLLVRLGASPEALRDVDRGRLPDYFSAPPQPLDVSEIADVAAERFTRMQLPAAVRRALLSTLQRSAELLDAPTIGVYGKVAESKGSYDLLSALDLLAGETDVTLFGAVGGAAPLFRDYLASVTGHERLGPRALLLPFLAPWRIPSFLDACSLVCLLERRFDVALHRSRLPEEVMRRGRPLIMSAEVADKLAFRDRLADGENYVRVEDPADVKRLSQILGSLLADPAGLHELGAAGAALAADVATSERPDGPTAAIKAALRELQAAR